MHQLLTFKGTAHKAVPFYLQTKISGSILHLLVTRNAAIKKYSTNMRKYINSMSIVGKKRESNKVFLLGEKNDIMAYSGLY
jgi:hypothetical protein